MIRLGAVIRIFRSNVTTCHLPLLRCGQVTLWPTVDVLLAAAGFAAPLAAPLVSWASGATRGADPSVRGQLQPSTTGITAPRRARQIPLSRRIAQRSTEIAALP